MIVQPLRVIVAIAHESVPTIRQAVTAVYDRAQTKWRMHTLAVLSGTVQSRKGTVFLCCQGAVLKQGPLTADQYQAPRIYNL